MRRANHERLQTIRIWRNHLAWHGQESINCKCEYDVGRFRKSQRIGGCGQSKCYLCHCDKLMKRPKLQRLRSDISYNEWIQEYPPNNIIQPSAKKRR